MGGLNLVIAYGFSLKFWVYYKIFGTLGLSFIFIIAQAFYMNKHMIEEPSNTNPTTPSRETHEQQ